MMDGWCSEREKLKLRWMNRLNHCNRCLMNYPNCKINICDSTQEHFGWLKIIKTILFQPTGYSDSILALDILVNHYLCKFLTLG